MLEGEGVGNAEKEEKMGVEQGTQPCRLHTLRDCYPNFTRLYWDVFLG